MPRGKHPHAYFQAAAMDKPIEDIYADLDSFTDEVFAEDRGRQSVMSTFILLPPVRYRDRVLKGILFTHGADLLVERLPRLKELFFVFAYSMWCSVPQSVHADGLFTLYPNADREAWFKRQHPTRAHQLWLPFEDADFFDHYRYAPDQPETRVRDIDVLCVARPDGIKNLPMFAAAVRRLQDGRAGRPLRCVLVTGREVDINLERMEGAERNIVREVQRELGAASDALYFEPQPQTNLAGYYGRAKCFVLCSLVEGKNRAIHEAASCDTPVVTFAQFNQYIRGGHPVLPGRAGAVAPAFEAEALANTILDVLDHPERFAPREAVLSVSGRAHVFNACIDALPYYREALPGFVAGQHVDNAWLDLAMWQTHRLGVRQHLFAPYPSLVWTKGLSAFEEAFAKVETALGRPPSRPPRTPPPGGVPPLAEVTAKRKAAAAGAAP